MIGFTPISTEKYSSLMIFFSTFILHSFAWRFNLPRKNDNDNDYTSSLLSFKTKLALKVQLRVTAIRCKSLSVKLSRFIFALKFCGLYPNCLASSASDMFPRFTSKIRIFSTMLICISLIIYII